MLTFAENSIDLTSSSKRGGDAAARPDAKCRSSELLPPGPPAWCPTATCRKLLVEAHRRLPAPLTALSFALVALVAGADRHVPPPRRRCCAPLAAMLAVVALLALGLAIANLAARDTALIPLIWVQALLPGAGLRCGCCWDRSCRAGPQSVRARLGMA